LRAVAAIAVVLHHASVSLFAGDHALIPFDIGMSGVDLFFVISGFVIFYTTIDDKTQPLTFLSRRLIRIVPIYFILTTLAYLIAVFAPQLTDTFSSNPYDYIRSILFIPYINPVYNLMRPEVGQGWSLNYEIFFYLIFGSLLVFRLNTRMMVCIATFVLLATLGGIINLSNVLATTYTDSIMLEFMFGLIIGYVVTRRNLDFGKLVILFLGTAVAAISLAAASSGEIPRFVTFGIPSAAIVAGMIWLERQGKMPKWPILLLVGDASYSLYLTHTFVLAIARRIWMRIFDIMQPLTHVTFMIVAVLITTGVAVLIFQRFENPLTKRLLQLVKGRTKFTYHYSPSPRRNC